MLVIFGGRNDNASDLELSSDDLSSFTVLNDLMIYDFEFKNWTCIAQFGFRPSPRWSAALAVSE